MAVILKELIKNYKLYVYELSDQRTIDWPLMGSPFPVITIVGLYLWFVLKLGPAFMKNREPFNVDRAVQIYNAVQVILCTYLLSLTVFIYGPWGHYSFICQSISWEDNEYNRFILKSIYLYFSLKILDLLDTVFFVLRKKQSQITFLHVYHHALMVFVIWITMRFIPGGHAIYIGVINSLVHAVMYAYYFITNYNKEYRKNIWWKKYITQLQLFQFGSILVHLLIPIVFRLDCDYPKVLISLLIPQNLFIFVLFWDFYKKTYWQVKPSVQSPQKTK